MTRTLILAAAFTFALAAPAAAQHAGHSASSAPAADSKCPPEHAAMGHCKPSPTASPAPAAPAQPADNRHATYNTTAPQAPATDLNCPPEHAAMGHCKPAVTMPAPPAPAYSRADSHAGQGTVAPQAPAKNPSCSPEHAAMGHCMPNAGPTIVTPPVAPPPEEAFSGPEHAADTVFDPQLMAIKRAEELIAEHGGYTGYMVLFDRVEYRAVNGADGYAWDGEAWYGGDYNRFWLKMEGEGEFGGAVEVAEVQALYSRAVDPWFNLQAGVRYDIRPKPDRAHLVLGLQGLVPYWFELDGALFLSDKGELTARLEAEYDQRTTNRLILQPRVEFDLSAHDVPELGIGAGLSSAEVGVRLRYEIQREFAPYVGVQYERRFGDTGDFARAEGEWVSGWAFLFGLRSWL